MSQVPYHLQHSLFSYIVDLMDWPQKLLITIRNCHTPMYLRPKSFYIQGISILLPFVILPGFLIK